jgi:hypothetical protein
MRGQDCSTRACLVFVVMDSSAPRGSRPGPGRPRRRLASLAAAAGLAIAIAGCSQSPGHLAPDEGNSSGPQGSSGVVSPGSSRLSGVAGRALFGGTTLLARDEGALGRKLAIVRIYDYFGQPFPGTYAKFMAAGSTLMVSMDSPGPSYADIAAGNQDASIVTFLKAVNRAAYHYHLGAIYICFEHEPDNIHHASLGGAADFIKAWDHIHQLAVRAHLDWNDGGRLHWVFIMLQAAYQPGDNGAEHYWPGAGEVDIVGIDGYNSEACKLARHHENIDAAEAASVTPASVFNPAVSFAVAHGGLPVFVTEWGSDTTPAGIQATFIRRMQAYVTATPRIAAVMYWDGTGLPAQGVTCNYVVNNNRESMSALATMGHSPVLQGRI